MSPSGINVNRTFNAISTDPSYTNTFTVTGLKPNTNYTVSVRAVSPQLTCPVWSKVLLIVNPVIQ